MSRNNRGMKDEYTEELTLRIKKLMEENPSPLPDDRDEDGESVFDDVSSCFIIGLKKHDRDLMAAALDAAAEKNLYRNVSWDEDIKRRIALWSKFPSVCERLSKGEKLEWKERKEGFNTFIHTPEELLEIYSASPITRISPVRELIDHVSDHIYGLWLLLSSPRVEALYSLIKDYLASWLDDFVSLLEKHVDELSDEREIAPFVCVLMTDEKYDASMKRALDLFSSHLPSPSFRSLLNLLPGSPLKTAIALGNRTAYERLIATAIIPDDLVYPENDVEILSSLFSLGLLLPGTEEGRRAFMLTLESYDPSAEILTRIFHPSYWDDDNAYTMTPLTAAVKNVNFSPEKYSLIIRNKEDIERWNTSPHSLSPLGYALLSHDRKKVDALLSLGADISWRDRCGNSIFHYAVAKIVEPHLIDRIVAVTPMELIESRNKFGESALIDLRKGENSETVPNGDMLASLYDRPLSNSNNTLVTAPDPYPEYRFRIGAFLSLISERIWDVTMVEHGFSNRFATIYVRSYSELERVYMSPFESSMTYIIFIENVEDLLREKRRRTEEIISSLNLRRNVTLIVSTQMPFSSLLDNILSLADDWNIVMLPSLSRLGFSRILNTGRRIRTDGYSVLVRCNGEFFRSCAYYEKPRKSL